MNWVLKRPAGVIKEMLSLEAGPRAPLQALTRRAEMETAPLGSADRSLKLYGQNLQAGGPAPGFWTHRSTLIISAFPGPAFVNWVLKRPAQESYDRRKNAL